MRRKHPRQRSSTLLVLATFFALSFTLFSTRAGAEENVVVAEGDRIVSFSERAPHVSLYTAADDSGGGSATHAELTVEEACFGTRCVRTPEFDLGLPAHTGFVTDGVHVGAGAGGKDAAWGDAARGEAWMRVRTRPDPGLFARVPLLLLQAKERRAGVGGDDSERGAAVHDAPRTALSMRMTLRHGDADDANGPENERAQIGVSIEVFFVDPGVRFEAWGERIETQTNTLAVVTRVFDLRNATARGTDGVDVANVADGPFSLQLRWTGADTLLHTQNYVGNGNGRDGADAGAGANAADGSARVSATDAARNRTAFLQLGKTAYVDGVYMPAGTRVALHDRTAVCEVVLPQARTAGYLAMIGLDAQAARHEESHISPKRLIATAIVVVALLIAGTGVIMTRLRREARERAWDRP